MVIKPNWRDEFSSAVAKAAELARKEAKQAAQAANFEPMYLYYRKGELRLTALEVDDTWTNTGISIGVNVPYSAFETWIAKHSGNLPFLSE